MAKTCESHAVLHGNCPGGYIWHLHIWMEGVAWINVEDKEVAWINVLSPQVSGTDLPDHYGQIGPLWLTPNSE